jgi:hypothetical protein
MFIILDSTLDGEVILDSARKVFIVNPHSGNGATGRELRKKAPRCGELWTKLQGNTGAPSSNVDPVILHFQMVKIN